VVVEVVDLLLCLFLPCSLPQGFLLLHSLLCGSLPWVAVVKIADYCLARTQDFPTDHCFLLLSTSCCSINALASWVILTNPFAH
jgi:hypothetical protein